jgi:hypothetical protein
MKILKAANIGGGQIFVKDDLGVLIPVVVADIELLCEGKIASEGFVLIDKDKYFYLTKTTSDLTAALDILSGLIDKLSSDILAANQGGNITTPTFQADLTMLKMQIEQLKQMQI